MRLSDLRVALTLAYLSMKELMFELSSRQFQCPSWVMVVAVFAVVCSLQ